MSLFPSGPRRPIKISQQASPASNTQSRPHSWGFLCFREQTLDSWVRILACSCLANPCCASSTSSACMAPRTTCTPRSRARARPRALTMVLLVRAKLAGRATSPCLASGTALAVGESLAGRPQLSPHRGNELLEVILKRKDRARGRLAVGTENTIASMK